ncbi:DUF5715 family protein [Roseisolibacter sp. H3M3-2]|uniref:DUF5715 family protein n=1 Tax=Roseisolibacter sp. H3M3-2 TaxID=3031323 RepID=UPI0023D9D7D2|nr:DUF5715 family protein [Roseisolibacter sp. H3M3-2]MDF1505235.1 DUF5715 family protein [Roseisolibacter sp. H3M3-2]
MRLPVARGPLRAPVLVLAALAAAAGPARAQSLRGSPESVERMWQGAMEEGLSFHETPDEVEASARFGRLVALQAGEDVVLRNVAFPYVTPATKQFVEVLGARHRLACGKPLMVTSAARPATRQPSNSVALSVHPTGMAVDLRKPTGRCLKWLRGALLELEESGVVEAIEERRPPHFHVAVFSTSFRQYAAAHRRGAAPKVAKVVAAATATRATKGAKPAAPSRVTTVAARRKAAGRTSARTLAKAPARRYKVRDGDTLWDIARANRVTVKQLLAANRMKKPAIRPGQRLVLPTAPEVEAGQ